MKRLKLLVDKHGRQGRNSQGRITVRHRGGGVKHFYRIVDFERKLKDVCGKVLRIEEDPNRTAKIGLIGYSNGVLSYVIIPEGVEVGNYVGRSEEIRGLGCVLEVSKFYTGDKMHNVGMRVGEIGKIGRVGGSSVIKKHEVEGGIEIEVRRGKRIKISGEALGVLGEVKMGEKESENKKRSRAVAGRKRRLGHRPTVRGVAMNPVDHPHGGGEGKTSGGRHPVTPWGKLTRGVKTRKKNKK